MDEKTIQEKIDLYRRSLAEWIRREADAVAKANACRGAIEALEGLLPAVPLEDVVKSIGGDRG